MIELSKCKLCKVEPVRVSAETVYHPAADCFMSTMLIAESEWRTLMSSPAGEGEAVAKPYCWIYETPGGYVRYWSRDFEKAAKFAADNNVELQALYTAPPDAVLRDAELFRFMLSKMKMQDPKDFISYLATEMENEAAMGK